MVDFLVRRAKGYLGIIFKIVVWILTCKDSYCRVGLQRHKRLVVVDVKRGLIRVVYLPHYDYAHFNRITHLVIYLDRFTVKIAGTQRNEFLAKERIDPVETVLLYRAFVVAEKNQHG